MPASPIASNYPLNEQWAPLAVYGKRAPLRRKLRGQHKLTRKAKLWKRTVGNGKRRTRGLCLSPRALANWFQSLTSNSDCCYHRLSVARVLRSYSFYDLWRRRPLAEFANSALAKNLLPELRNNRWLAHTGVEPTSSKQAPTLHQLNAVMRVIYRLSGRPRCSVICFPSHSVHRTLGHAPL